MKHRKRQPEQDDLLRPRIDAVRRGLHDQPPRAIHGCLVPAITPATVGFAALSVYMPVTPVAPFP